MVQGVHVSRVLDGVEGDHVAKVWGGPQCEGAVTESREVIVEESLQCIG